VFIKYLQRQDPTASDGPTKHFRRATDTEFRNLEVVEDDSPEAWQVWQDAVARQALEAEETENTQPAPLGDIEK
jgi:hypothetical protein